MVRNLEPIKLLEDRPVAESGGSKGKSGTHYELSWDSLTEFSNIISKCVIPSLGHHCPLLISGDWGAGKTSLLRHVQGTIDSNSHAKTIWFDAWRYENESDLLQALIRVAWDEYESSVPEAATAAKDICTKTLAIAGAIGVRWLSRQAGLGNMGLKALADDINKIDSDVPLENDVDKLVCSFRKLLCNLWDGREVIVFVDDLDRCSPESAVALLESIRGLLNANEKIGCKFVIIMDKSTLAEAVKEKYSSLSSYDANRYLEKMFPQIFSVPHPSTEEISSLVNKLITELNEKNQGETSNATLIKKNVSHSFVFILSKPEYANPRLIKRCLNRYAFFQYIRGEKAYEHHEDLILWLAAIERWPLLRRLLRRKPDSFWSDFLQLLQKDGETGEPDGDELASQPGIREFFANFNDSSVSLRMRQFGQIDRELSNFGL